MREKEKKNIRGVVEVNFLRVHDVGMWGAVNKRGTGTAEEICVLEAVPNGKSWVAAKK